MRILVADDHAVVRSGLKTILGAREGWEICAEAETGEEAVALAKRYRPDVVILDLSMPESQGSKLRRRSSKVCRAWSWLF